MNLVFFKNSHTKHGYIWWIGGEKLIDIYFATRTIYIFMFLVKQRIGTILCTTLEFLEINEFNTLNNK
jgi:hypothetical protein